MNQLSPTGPAVLLPTRIPAELAAAVKEAAQQAGVTKSEIVRRSLVAYVGNVDNSPEVAMR